MPKPTVEQLSKINKFAHKELTTDEVFVFSNMMIDDMVTAYHSIIHPNLLRKFVRDANRGIGLLMNHNSRQLPVGRSFNAYLREEYIEDVGSFTQSVYGDFYIDLGRQTESGMSTDDIVKGIEAGTIFDTSIGFKADSWKCSICGNDIRDYQSCSHFPGEKYDVIDSNGVHHTETCYVVVGEDGEGELLENSLVYAGAVDRATIVKNFSNSVNELEKGSKLHLVDNFKNIPLSATIYQYYSKNGEAVLFTDTPERTNGFEELVKFNEKRSEQNVELAEFKEVLDKFGIKVDTAEEFSSKLDEFSKLSELIVAKDNEIDNLSKELAAVSTELEEVNTKLEEKNAVIEELTNSNEELLKKADLAETYRKDLINQALTLGVRAQGNAFNSTMYEKFLNTLSVDEIKEIVAGFNEEIKARFNGTRVSGIDESKSKRFSNEPQSREDFETEQEFRDFVAAKALQYAKDNNLSIAVATKEIYRKFSKNGSEE